MKKHDKSPKREKRKVMGIEVKIDKVMVLQSLEAEGVVLKVRRVGFVSVCEERKTMRRGIAARS